MLIALVLFAVFWWPRGGDNEADPGELLPPPEDPRVTFATSFLNVRPKVRYVGDDACASCHKAITKSYHQHPMGQSLAPVSEAVNVERYDANAHNPFSASGLTFLVEKTGNRVVHKETAGPGVLAENEIAYAIGSGRRGRSYIVNHDGYLFESPITWYPLKGIWDLSPGFKDSNQHFGRPIVAGCLFCHTNQVEPEIETTNGFKAPLFRGYAIGCERCHGPGELHVAHRRGGEHVDGVDYSIVNPRHLEHSLREAVCQQCHLHSEARVLPRGREFFDFRPGLPLHLFLVDFLRPADQREENQFAGTVEQMYVSRCFEKTSGDGKLGCISCHDPHALPAPEGRVDFYRRRCQACHEEKPCSLALKARLEKSPEDSCIVCHMPNRGGSITHTAITDHSIPRKPRTAGAPAKSGTWPRPGQMPLELFPPSLVETTYTLHRRDLGVALINAEGVHGGKEADRMMAELALPLVNKAVRLDPLDIAAWEAKATALYQLGRLEEALAACDSSLNHNPDRETTLLLAASTARPLGRSSKMLAYGKRAFEINPWRPVTSQVLADAYSRVNELKKAAEAGRKAVQTDPLDVPTRQFLIVLYIELGDLPKAREELEACLVMSPPSQREAFRQWFARQLAEARKS
jgi:Flp pilus assembly protein TadD